MSKFEDAVVDSLKDRIKFPETDQVTEKFEPLEEEETKQPTEKEETKPSDVAATDTKEKEQAKTEDSSLKDEKVVEPTKEKKEEEKSPAAVDNNFDKDAYRKQIEEELNAKFEERLKEVTSKDPFANEQIKKLNELAAAGIDTNSPDFWKWQYEDLDKYDTSTKEGGLSLRRLELEIENPQLKPNQIERLLKRAYPALFDENIDAEDTEYQEAIEDLSIDATRSVTKLKKHQESVTLPKVDLKKKEEEEKAAKAAREHFIKDVRTNVQNYKEDPIRLSDELEIKYSPSEDAVKFVESSIINNQTFFIDNYTTEEGIDYNRLNRDLGRIHDFDNIVKTVYEQGISIGREEVADTLENSSTNIQEQKKDTAKSIKEQIGEQLRNQFSRKR